MIAAIWVRLDARLIVNNAEEAGDKADKTMACPLFMPVYVSVKARLIIDYADDKADKTMASPLFIPILC